ncbi:MAG: hypothetical protein JO253_03125 [Alphaproteobacteria bacterium]|nr:hypothetical protein [Alphaproteobacteria bacterium]
MGLSSIWIRRASIAKTNALARGYHFTHRIKSPYCIHNPEYEVRVRCGRYGELEADVRDDIARREKEESIELEKNNTTQADAIHQHSEAT